MFAFELKSTVSKKEMMQEDNKLSFHVDNRMITKKTTHIDVEMFAVELKSTVSKQEMMQ